MNKKHLKILVISLCLGGLLGVIACATGGGAGSPASPAFENPQQNDPEFWKMWQDSRGLG